MGVISGQHRPTSFHTRHTHTQRYGPRAIVSLENDSHCCPGFRLVPDIPEQPPSFLPPPVPFLHTSPAARHGEVRGASPQPLCEPTGLARRLRQAERKPRAAVRCCVIARDRSVHTRVAREAAGLCGTGDPLKERK